MGYALQVTGQLWHNGWHEHNLKRYDGELKAASRSRTGKKNKSKASASQSNSILLPDYATFDCYLIDLLNPVSPRPHRLAALFEMLPAWLRFLESRGLIDADQHAQSLSELGDLAASLVEFWHSYSSESAPRLAAERWPERVPRTPPTDASQPFVTPESRQHRSRDQDDDDPKCRMGPGLVDLGHVAEVILMDAVYKMGWYLLLAWFCQAGVKDDPTPP
ncbi:MAG TPA: hypothetical protein VL334_00605 [Anaerolineae bacterium]|nr:hypothetical protein [Anaerolineae bacterium]